MLELIDKQKVRADNYITGFLVIFYLIFAVFFRLEWIMSVIVYPFVALFFYGLLKIINVSHRRNNGNGESINKILFGIISMMLSIFILYIIMVQPNVTTQLIVNLTAFPLVIVGFAGIIKGILVNLYSIKHRVLSILIGIITILVCLLTLFIPFLYFRGFFLLNLIILSLTLLVNVLSRAALYLSEYGLSLIHFSNFKLFFYIISDYLLFVDEEGNIILDKVEVKRKPKDDEPMMTLKKLMEGEL
ncbi:MAG: hypothetical protein ACFFEO_16560 [Candidatus Thorarchaeota archaeon]